MPLDADERELQGPLNDDKLKWYVGKKAVSRLGCFGCHNIPGFEFAKPIGTPLNDWGKKDAERLAFEDSAAFVHEHFNFENVLRRDDPKQWVFDGKKPPFERYFYDALHHHQRDGFLHLKLQEPRSFDFHRERTWDDRLRMPQFKFAHSTKRNDESDEAFNLRATREEAEAREAVMTFVLGLLAEPVPLSYLNNPSPDRLAEVLGRQVLDKYNCGGCHQVRAGIYEFNKSPGLLQQLKDAHQAAQARDASDHVFPDHNAWVGRASPNPNRLTIHGVPYPPADEKVITLWLTQALRFQDAERKPVDIRAGEFVDLSETALDPRMSAGPYGGAFVDLLIPYLKDRKLTVVTDDNTARAALPPPLLREGEKVQPGWLFQFLRNPGKIRPQMADGDGFLVLRMPRFNMSDEEAQILVNNFGAVDRLENPGYGLTYPYLTVPQREEEFWRKHSQDYAARLEKEGKLSEREKSLQPIWKIYRQGLEDQLKEVDERLKAAEADVQKALDAEKQAKDDKKKLAEEARKRAEVNRDNLKKYGQTLKDQLADATPEKLEKQWKGSQVYGTDAFRLLVRGPCLACHQAGGLGQAAKGPPLDLSAERLRPEWTERWLAHPRRLTTYLSPMPQNFENNKREFQEYFSGSSRQQIEALRDLLMDFRKQADLPADRYFLTSPGGD
jgi:hypothetical protein